MGRVWFVQPDIHEERPTLAFANEAHRILSRCAHAGVLLWKIRRAIEDSGLVEPIGRHGRRSGATGIREVPLAEVAGAVAGVFEEA